jgi:hypothetical protein
MRGGGATGYRRCHWSWHLFNVMFLLPFIFLVFLLLLHSYPIAIFMLLLSMNKVPSSHQFLFQLTFFGFEGILPNCPPGFNSIWAAPGDTWYPCSWGGCGKEAAVSLFPVTITPPGCWGTKPEWTSCVPAITMVALGLMRVWCWVWFTKWAMEDGNAKIGWGWWGGGNKLVVWSDLMKSQGLAGGISSCDVWGE